MRADLAARFGPVVDRPARRLSEDIEWVLSTLLVLILEMEGDDGSLRNVRGLLTNPRQIPKDLPSTRSLLPLVSDLLQGLSLSPYRTA